MILGVDVDLTLVDSDLHWLAWLTKRRGYVDYVPPEPHEGLIPYDLSTATHPEGSLDDLYAFWRTETTYDSMLPKDGAVEALVRFKRETGGEVVFVSHVKGNHHKSKYNFLEKYFGSVMDGFIATQEKQYARVDVLIDDRFKNLNSLVNTQGILFNSQYTQCEEPTKDYPCLAHWSKLNKALDGITTNMSA